MLSLLSDVHGRGRLVHGHLTRLHCSADPSQYMILDAGLPQPDLVICVETPFSEILTRGGIAPSLFVNIDFQQQLRKRYADPRIWKGINVLVLHDETQMNRWASRKALVRRIQGELLLRSQPKPWCYLWEESEVCSTCCLDINTQQPVFKCFRCTKLIHYVCLMETQCHRRYPSVKLVLLLQHEKWWNRNTSEAAPLEESAGIPGEPVNGPPEEGSLDVELRDPYLNPLEEIVLDTGSLPCAKHGYDHLSRDPTCEFCKRALGPLYHHLSKKYGQSLGDQTPTLSFDFSGPHPVAVTGARFMLLFVWRLDTVRLLWAFAVTGKNREYVRSCLNDVVAELNTYRWI